MSLDRLKQMWGVKGTRTTKPIQDLPRVLKFESPQDALNARNRDLRRMLIKESVECRRLVEEKLISIPDAGSDGHYMSMMNESEASSIWLDPEIWEPSLTLFAGFIKMIGGNSIYLLVESHVEKDRMDQQIIARPIEFGVSKWLASDYAFGLTPAREVSFVGQGVNLFPLGNLDPSIRKDAIRKQTKQGLPSW